MLGVLRPYSWGCAREGRVGTAVRDVAKPAKPGLDEIVYTTIGILSAGTLQKSKHMFQIYYKRGPQTRPPKLLEPGYCRNIEKRRKNKKTQKKADKTETNTKKNYKTKEKPRKTKNKTEKTKQ